MVSRTFCYLGAVAGLLNVQNECVSGVLCLKLNSYAGGAIADESAAGGPISGADSHDNFEVHPKLAETLETFLEQMRDLRDNSMRNRFGSKLNNRFFKIGKNYNEHIKSIEDFNRRRTRIGLEKETVDDFAVKMGLVEKDLKKYVTGHKVKKEGDSADEKLKSLRDTYNAAKAVIALVEKSSNGAVPNRSSNGGVAGPRLPVPLNSHDTEENVFMLDGCEDKAHEQSELQRQNLWQEAEVEVASANAEAQKARSAVQTKHDIEMAKATAEHEIRKMKEAADEERKIDEEAQVEILELEMKRLKTEQEIERLMENGERKELEAERLREKKLHQQQEAQKRKQALAAAKRERLDKDIARLEEQSAALTEEAAKYRREMEEKQRADETRAAAAKEQLEREKEAYAIQNFWMKDQAKAKRAALKAKLKEEREAALGAELQAIKVEQECADVQERVLTEGNGLVIAQSVVKDVKNRAKKVANFLESARAESISAQQAYEKRASNRAETANPQAN